MDPGANVVVIAILIAVIAMIFMVLAIVLSEFSANSFIKRFKEWLKK